jgi:acyl-coenzyme A thioesterase PaaI-like protein
MEMDETLTVRNTEEIVAAQATLEATRAAEHPRCLLCGTPNIFGLNLEFRVRAVGLVSGEFSCRPVFQSYPKMLHGGITSALLDAAMTNCLFSLGVVAVTAELTVRYLSPVDLDCPVEVTGSLQSSNLPLYYMIAEMRQHGHVMAHAKAKFFETSTSAEIRADFLRS